MQAPPDALVTGCRPAGPCHHFLRLPPLASLLLPLIHAQGDAKENEHHVEECSHMHVYYMCRHMHVDHKCSLLMLTYACILHMLTHADILHMLTYAMHVAHVRSRHSARRLFAPACKILSSSWRARARVSWPRGTGSAGDSVGEGLHWTLFLIDFFLYILYSVIFSLYFFFF